jgi:hypothetical protein
MKNIDSDYGEPTDNVNPSHTLLSDSTPYRTEAGEAVKRFVVTVVFTTAPATLLALQQANQLAKHLNARIRILVPYVVPYPLPIDCPQADPKFKIKALGVPTDGAIETCIDVRLCRDYGQALKQGLCPRSTVLIGGRTRWWPTREKRLAKILDLAGHHVIFIPQE